ncbi:MAG: class II aldolase/adducin family protein, partial [Myxococcaceae bacterium]
MLSLAQACHAVGQRIPYWTQGAGGNLSVKDGDALFIKASGLRLDSVSPERGVAEVSLAEARERLGALSVEDPRAEEAYAAALAPRVAGAPRASMETGMHVWLPERWVSHFHSLPALLMAGAHAREPARFATWL